jgi:hypothetical protein
MTLCCGFSIFYETVSILYYYGKEKGEMKIRIFLLLIVFVTGLLPTHVFAQCTKGNCTDGKGTMVYTEGGLRTYVGEFKNGKRDGKGTLTYSDQTKSRGQKQYEGQWKEGAPSGKGTLTFFDDRKFVGQWKSETVVKQQNVEIGAKVFPATFRQVIVSAEGTMFYPDGRKEVGEFKNDQFHKK